MRNYAPRVGHNFHASKGKKVFYIMLVACDINHSVSCSSFVIHCCSVCGSLLISLPAVYTIIETCSYIPHCNECCHTVIKIHMLPVLTTICNVAFYVYVPNLCIIHRLEPNVPA